MKKRLVALLTSIALIITFLPFTAAPVLAEPEDIPDTPEQEFETPQEILDQLADPSIDAFDFTSETAKEAMMSVTYPESFDLRNVDTDGDGIGDTSYITKVKSQAPFGSCWSFAALAAAESSLLSSSLAAQDGLTCENLDLSEKQMAYFSRVALNDPNNPQDGEGKHYEILPASGSILNQGGNAIIATSVMAQGIGPMNESAGDIFMYKGLNGWTDKILIDDVWQNYSYLDTDDWSIPESERFTRAYSLRESKILPAPAGRQENGDYEYNEAGTNAIKEELMNHRAVDISFYADSSMPTSEPGSSTYISDKWAHYTFVPYYSTHAVTVVGWDDNYSKDNFLQGTTEVQKSDGTIITVDRTPPADGAWLVKNSWGSELEDFPNKGAGDWGIEDENGKHTGYFWMSYYDQSLLNAGTFILDKSGLGDEYIIDQHDYLPVNFSKSAKTRDVMKMGNVFYAEQCEMLEAVSCFTSYPGTKVTYNVYLLHNNTIQNPEDGILVASETEEYRFGGFHKKDLSDPIMVMKDQAYAITVTMETPENEYAVCIQADNGGGVLSGGSYSTGIINSGESYIYVDGRWEDYKYADDIREALAESIGIYDDYEEPTFDNFPIKGYCRKLDTNLNFTVLGKTALYYKAEGEDSSILRIHFYGDTDTFPPENYIVDWKVAEDGQDVLSISPVEGMQNKAELKAIGEGNTYIYAKIEGIGTEVIKSSAVRHSFNDMSTKDSIYVLTYTGEEIRPEVVVSSFHFAAVEGRDYTLTYQDNIQCGLAKIEAIRTENVTDVSQAITYFAIVPPKAEITNVEPGDSKLTVSLKDLSESGLTGYRIRYRKAGDEEWQEMTIEADKTQAVIDGIEQEGTYEIQADGFVKLPYNMWFLNNSDIAYGEPSEIETGTPESHVHEWGEPTYTWSDDNKQVTAERVCALNEEHKETETVDAVEEIVVEPTKTKDGKANYTAEFQNPAFEAQTKEDVVLPATGTEEDKIIEDLQNQLEDLARQIEELKEQLKHNPGWELVDDNWYYYDQNRQMVKGWVKVNNVWYFMDKETGIMQTGWVKDGDVWYYMKSSGAMAVGWIQVGDSWYYMKDNGAMAVGWIQVGDTWYYMKDNGAMAVGWIQVGDTWYYMKDNGAMAVGWIQDGETWYYMKSSGAMAASEWVAGYYWLSSSGAWTYQPVGSWQKNNQGWWFGDTSGWYAKNETVRISDVWYEFDAAGYWAQ